MQAQARYVVGAASFELPGAGRKSLYAQARQTLDRGPYGERLRFVVVAGELMGPEEALAVLGKLERLRRSGGIEASEEDVESARKLRRLYAGYLRQAADRKRGKEEQNSEEKVVRPALPEEDQGWLRSRLGWFGDLALAPEGADPEGREEALAPARRTFFVFISLFAAGLMGLSVGGFLLLLFAFLAHLGRLRGGLSCPTGRGAIYAETFALYMVLFVGVGVLSRFVPLPSGPSSLWLNGLIMLLSLTALAWPVVRGVGWPQVREDVGLSAFGRPGVQVLSGPACYLVALPLLLVGVGVTLALLLAQRRLGWGNPFEPGAGPSHPIIGVALSGGVWVWVQVFLVACVAAPVVEEIMFRGVLYRHLREASHHWGRARSILTSALASSFVFAVIHPQGVLGVPVLMALAVAFALAREWRQSLLPPMIAHGLNNGVATLVLLLAAS
jgi:membrane protease YdiL (CAAX protease family)